MNDVLHPSTTSRGFQVRTERWVVCLVLLFTLVSLGHFIHDHWYATDPHPRVPRAAVVSGPAPIGYAPNVYRVGMPFLQSLLERVLPFHWSVLLTLLDVVFGFIGLFALYRVLVHGMSIAASAWVYRAPMVLAYLAAIALPLTWVVPWQRPETMPSMCFLALATCCLLRLRRGPAWVGVLLVLTLLQALTRSDVAAAFGVAIVLTALAGRFHADFAPRRRMVLTGAGVVAVAVGTQAYLQLVAFPHAPYPPKTPLLVLPWNFSAHVLNVFFIAVGPFLAVVAAGLLRRQRWQGTDVLAMVAAGVYLPVWFLVGSVTEVRIFVPFLLLLCVPAARILAALLMGDDGRALAANDD